MLAQGLNTTGIFTVETRQLCYFKIIFIWKKKIQNLKEIKSLHVESNERTIILYDWYDVSLSRPVVRELEEGMANGNVALNRDNNSCID